MGRPTGPRPVKIDLAGKKFPNSRWFVVSRNFDQKERGVWWNCVCECGNTSIIKTGNLTNGLSRSCGCLAREINSVVHKTHGKTNAKIYKCWLNMKSRCTNPKHTDYHNYGGRGITVCDRWVNSFENFYSDVGDPPTSTHTIDRIDVNKGYSPDNIRWATKQEQADNRRKITQIENYTTEEIIAELNRRGFAVTFSHK